MKFKFENYSYVFEKKRFTDKKIAGELTAEEVASECIFSPAGKTLFVKAVKAAAESSIALSGKGKTLPLQGVIDLTTKTIHIGALTPRDEMAIIFNEQPLFEHKKPGLFETGQYSPRLRSYQTKYSDGPSAHQQLLFHAVEKKQVSADDAKNKRGFAINIKVTDQEVTVVVDGNSLSINETAQYLRTIHSPGHELSKEEARNDILKAAGIYSPFCEAWVLDKIEQACSAIILEQLKLEEELSLSLASKASVNPFAMFGSSSVDTFDQSIEFLNQASASDGDLPEITVAATQQNDIVIDNPTAVSTII